MTDELTDGERRELRRKARAATLDALRALDGEARREEIRERALADGGFTPRELAAAPPEKVAAKFDRLVDHALSWSLTNLKRDGLVENLRWSVWCLAGAAAEAPAAPLAESVLEDRLAQLRTVPYRDYLRTPEWRRTRAAALLRAGNACSMDVLHTDDLVVHHRTYERLGCELPGDLIVLCSPCHDLHHGEHGRPRRPAADAELRRPAALADRRRPSLLRRLLAGPHRPSM